MCERFCAGVVSGPVITGIDTGVGNDHCTIESRGLVHPTIAGLGPWCGWSSGEGEALIVVDASAFAVNLTWPQSAGGVLPLVIQDSSTGDILGTGAVHAIGAQPGPCGLWPPDFDPSSVFAVTGFATMATA